MFKSILFALFAAAVSVRAELHVVHFENKCGFGTPTLVQNGQILSTGSDFISNGPLLGAIAYLQTGNCTLSGEGCTVIEINLKNPTSVGSGSSTDISLIPPHKFSVTSGFGYYNGCDGAGANCNSANCPSAFKVIQVTCQTNDANLAVVFCG